MPCMNGAEVTKKFSEIDPTLQLATYSGERGADVFETTFEAGSRYFIQKGMEPRQLLAIVKTFCDRFEASNKTIAPLAVTEPEIARIESTGLAGCSRHLLEVTNLIYTYAKDDETVLIRGANGVGKELVARAIHNFSSRRGLFIPVNCGALPHDLLESELFGHEKGAFSGAIKSKTGLITAANRGTIFLDEIGDLAPLLQVKLLRFLQEGEVRPVGSETTLKVNTRVIAATNANLEQAMKEGRFREDFYYRIKVLPIHLLPLKERPEDIKPLVLQFSRAISEEKGIKKEFLEETVKVLERFDWPGNIRELEHIVRRAILRAPGEKVMPEHLDSEVREFSDGREVPDGGTEYGDCKAHLMQTEKKFILRKAEQARSARELAKLLGIRLSTLQGRLKALGLTLKFPTKQEREMNYETT